MGSDFSRCFRAADESSPSTANVINAAGELRRYAVPATVSGVLASETASSPAWFISNSDGLDYGEPAPEMRADDELQANQIYFILPRADLRRRLTAPDMAAMALKANAALAPRLSGGCTFRAGRSRTSRVSPAGLNTNEIVVKPAGLSKPGQMLRSGSVRRFQKYTSRRAKTAFNKLRLSTIQEGAPL